MRWFFTLSAWLRGKPSPRLLMVARRIRAEELARVTIEAAAKDCSKLPNDNWNVHTGQVVAFHECATLRVANLLMELQTGASGMNPNREQMNKARSVLGL